mmetsp:Transcript_37316/g.71532  ORF Transcript_37316/g.71532 Transcript_37316/m.71532 type:complete len:327 (+) Transcript_37316:426-1406(+)
MSTEFCWVLQHKCLERGAHVLSQLVGSFQQALIHQLNHRQPCGAPKRVAEVGGGVQGFSFAQPPGAHGCGRADAAAQGEAARQALPETQQVGHHSVRQLRSSLEQGPGAAEAGEDLVVDEQHVVPIAQPPQRAQPTGRGGAVPSAPLHGLHQDGGGQAWGAEAGERALSLGGAHDVGGGAARVRFEHALHQPLLNLLLGVAEGQEGRVAAQRALERRAEALLVVARSEHPERQAVVAAFEGEHAAAPGGHHRRLDRRLHRLRPRAPKDHLLQVSRRHARKLARQLDAHPSWESVPHAVQVRAHLLLCATHDVRVAVTGGGHTKACS